MRGYCPFVVLSPAWKVLRFGSENFLCIQLWSVFSCIPHLTPVVSSRNKFVDPHAQHPPAHQLRLPMAMNLRLRPVHDPRGPAELDGASSEICLTFRRLWPQIAKTRSKVKQILEERRDDDRSIHQRAQTIYMVTSPEVNSATALQPCFLSTAVLCWRVMLPATVQEGPPASISFPRRKVGTRYSTEAFVLRGQLRSGRPRGEQAGRR